MTYEVMGKRYEIGVSVHSLDTITDHINTGWHPNASDGVLVAKAEDLIKDLERAKSIYKNKYPRHRIVSVRYVGY